MVREVDAAYAIRGHGALAECTLRGTLLPETWAALEGAGLNERSGSAQATCMSPSSERHTAHTDRAGCRWQGAGQGCCGAV